MAADRKKILAEIEKIAFSDYSRFVCAETLSDGTQVITVTDTRLLKSRERAALAFFKAGTKGVELKLYDKLKALELLGKAEGVFGEKNELDDNVLADIRNMLDGVGKDMEEADEDG